MLTLYVVYLFYPFIFNLSVFLFLKYSSCGQYITGLALKEKSNLKLSLEKSV